MIEDQRTKDLKRRYDTLVKDIIKEINTILDDLKRDKEEHVKKRKAELKEFYTKQKEEHQIEAITLRLIEAISHKYDNDKKRVKINKLHNESWGWRYHQGNNNMNVLPSINLVEKTEKEFREALENSIKVEGTGLTEFGKLNKATNDEMKVLEELKNYIERNKSGRNLNISAMAQKIKGVAGSVNNKAHEENVTTTELKKLQEIIKERAVDFKSAMEECKQKVINAPDTPMQVP
ncbi:MAG: hypothetical protein ABIC04_02120 [Nanoarchaeota archaeon]